MTKISTQFNSYSLRFGLVLTLWSLAIGLAPRVTAQPVPTAAVAPTASTNFSGTVERYLLNREGLTDGLILNNGLQVKFPPHLSTSLTSAIKPGDRVKIIGSPGISSSFGQEVHAYSITNTSSGRTVVDQPSTTPPTPPTAVTVNYSNLSATGTAKYWLVGRQGELQGIVLSDGTQIHFPPHVGYQLSNLAKVGARVEAQGFGTNSSYGRILEATSLSISGQTVPMNGLPSGTVGAPANSVVPATTPPN